MKMDIKETPREFKATPKVTLKDCGTIFLDADEQFTFETETGKRHDLTRKEWGWYLSNSVNASLKKQGYKTAIVMSMLTGVPKIVVNLVEEDKVDEFLAYLEQNDSRVISWLDEWAV
ncbi:hypothetical protein [Desulfovibrio sp. JC010]|uniref:hypothetical protein n=1 Tax=Desulfovibrio sp. JC010 TaxID=2593641 RepID=UPI0013D3F697|nr:hypothetical protein [Desulfovibrio sp. JC010]NDV27182.1 hypothetical protein [Desulfovibrio sp. JC010]